ncbi:major facilitator superfamily transporter [Botrytis cinerea]
MNTSEKPETAQLEAVREPPSAQNGYHIDPVIEKRLVRKLDKHLVPLVVLLYLLSYLDRSNIGNAKTAGMTKDLGISSSEYEWLLTIFYIAYIVFEWFALMWKVLPPHIWACFCVIGWGTVATLQSATQSWSGMMAARFFLGFFEAGYGPGIPYLLSFFYLRHEIGIRIGIFLSAAPLATCFAGALAYGITSGHAAIASWRLLFLVEGLPCVAAGIMTFFVLPDSPEKARFLNEEERAVAKARGVRQVGAEEEHRVGGVKWADIAAALADPKATTSATGPRYTGVFLAAAGIFPAIANILPWVLNNQGSDTKRGTGIALLNMVGQCGPLLGTRMYPSEDGPYYRKGMWVCTAFMLFNGFLALALRILLNWENGRLDAKYGVVGRRDAKGNVVGEEETEDKMGEKPYMGAEGGDENDGPRFRYVL